MQNTPEYPLPQIPDHQLLRRIGRGGYGEVWLVRTVTGIYRAAKIVWRDRFADASPFEREFAAIQCYSRICLRDPGLLRVLHVGRNDPGGYMYYVMELADDAAGSTADSPIDYTRYIPHTLRLEADRLGVLPTNQVLQIAVNLARALQALHSHGLIHRDIKPSNIIYVGGIPKLGDVGLVTGIKESVTQVGTREYIPPEGLGQPGADVFALGLVLYELATGQGVQRFPFLSAGANLPKDRVRWRELNAVILRAAEPNCHIRYQKAENLLSDLLLVEAGVSVRGGIALRRRARLLTGVAAGLLVALLGVWGLYLQQHRAREIEHSKLLKNAAARANLLANDGRWVEALPTLAAVATETADDSSLKEVRFSALSEAMERTPPLAILHVYTNDINALQFHPQKSILAVALATGAVSLWDIDSAMELECLLPFPPVISGDKTNFVACQSLDISSDGTLLAAGSDSGLLKIYRWDSFKAPIRSWKFDGLIVSIQFSHDLRTVAVALLKSPPILLSLDDQEAGPVTLPVPDGWRVTFAPNDTHLVIGTFTNGVVMLDYPALTESKRFPLPAWVYDACVSPDGQTLIAACADHLAHVWDLPTQRELAGHRHADVVTHLRMSNDGSSVYTVARDAKASRWDFRKPNQNSIDFPQGANAFALATSPDDRLLAVGGDRGLLKVWVRYPRSASQHSESEGTGPQFTWTSSGRELRLVRNAAGLFVTELPSSGGRDPGKTTLLPPNLDELLCVNPRGDQGFFRTMDASLEAFSFREWRTLWRARLKTTPDIRAHHHPKHDWLAVDSGHSPFYSTPSRE